MCRSKISDLLWVDCDRTVPMNVNRSWPMSRVSGKAETISSSAECSNSADTPHHSRTSFPDYRHEVERVWNHNSAYWDSYMGEGNDFVNVLCWPAIEKLLSVQPGQLVLDVACGNGLTSRRLGRLGARVVAFDVAEEMIRFAKQRSTDEDGDIRYFVLDANDEKGMAKIGEGKFDGALSNMALFDMAEIEPLFRSLFSLLKPGGRFVFSMMHPCFNQASSALFGEREELDGEEVMTYGVRVSGYMTPTMFSGRALGGQPLPQPYFHRPLFALLNVGLRV
ncbi:MAG: class I SAM-dependent methyltransferase, partial [Caldilineaceae bacterium SB0670_bin_27]|nr:class I SAM-dependent methyltransferase [Caldilineaceae bacterium SB0670_bin_27]